MTTTERTPYVGARVSSRNGARFVRGAGRYTDDVHLPRELTLVLLRSPHPHARIVTIDTEKARQLDGVLAVATGEELFDTIGPQSYLWELPGQKVGHGRPLAVGKVRHVGEPVVAIVARDQYVAEDALELIEVTYEPLPAVTTYEQALTDGGTLLHEDWGDNVQVRAAWPVVIPGLPEPPDAGAALASAAVVISESFEIARMTATPMETRGVVCDYNPAGPKLTVWTSTQSPHQIRQGLAAMLGLAENHIRVIAPDVGGAFGMKAVMYPEEALVPYFALQLRRPVRFVEQSTENFVAATPSRAQRMRLDVGFDADGRIVGLRSRYEVDLGSAPSTCGAGTGWVTGALLCGPYAVPAIDIAATAVVTNKSPLGAFRGFGQPEANFPMERLLDIAARRLDIDPAELRRRNLVPAEAFPYTNAAGMLLDSGNYAALLDLAVEHPGYRAALAERDAARAEGRHVGIGLAFYNECTNFGPSGVFPLIGITQGGWDATTIAIEPDGRIRVTLGQTPMGQGVETALAQQAADAFGVDIADVTVLHGDTDSSHYTGYASGASRAAGIGGSSLLVAAGLAKDKLREIAAHLLEASPDDIEFRDGACQVRGGTGEPVPMARIAAAAYQGGNLPEGMTPGLEFLGTFDPVALAFSYGVVIALVELDPATGQVSVRRMIVGHDCGPQLNPAIVEGQIIGGLVQGIGTALLEELPYDEHGYPLATNLRDYPMPLAVDVPVFDLFHTQTPTPFSLNGAKGVGEGGVIASPAAIVNAIQDALPDGAPELTSIPVRPERILEALRSCE
jgi:carbon-monoxide dehydrogenase large subunit